MMTREGHFPVGIDFNTAMFFVSMTATLPAIGLVANNIVPSGVSATPSACEPIFNVVTSNGGVNLSLHTFPEKHPTYANVFSELTVTIWPPATGNLIRFFTQNVFRVSLNSRSNNELFP